MRNITYQYIIFDVCSGDLCEMVDHILWIQVQGDEKQVEA